MMYGINLKFHRYSGVGQLLNFAFEESGTFIIGLEYHGGVPCHHIMQFLAYQVRLEFILQIGSDQGG